AVNPLLEAPAIAELLNAARASILVTLAPFPGTDLWPKMAGILDKVQHLRHVVLVNLAERVRGLRRPLAWVAQKREEHRLHGIDDVAGAMPGTVKVHDFAAGLRRQGATRIASGRSFSPQDTSSYFCTGGTTGLPKIAVR